MKIVAICLPVGVGVRITRGIHATDFCRRFEAMQAVAVDARCAISHIRAYSTNASLGLHMVTHTRALLNGGVPFTRRASRYQWK